MLSFRIPISFALGMPERGILRNSDCHRGRVRPGIRDGKVTQEIPTKYRCVIGAFVV